MDDVGPDGDMNGDGNSEPGAGGKDTRRAIGKLSLRAVDVCAHGLAQALSRVVTQRDRFIEDAAGFLSHAESAFVDFGVHLLGGMTHEGQFKIMDDARAVHRDRGYQTLLHPVDEDGGEPDLNHVSADPDDHRPALTMGLSDGARDCTERLDCEDVGKRTIEQTEATSPPPRFRKVGHPDLAVPFLERIGL